MRKVYLLGEGDHDMDGKDLIELGLLKKIENESGLQMIALSLELEKKGENKELSEEDIPENVSTDLKFILNFARQRQIPVYASDRRDFSDYQRERELEDYLKKGIKNENSFEEYRILARKNIETRNDYSINLFDNYFNGRPDGYVVHICGLTHVFGLKRKLENKEYEVEAINLRKPRPILYRNGFDILQTLADVLAHAAGTELGEKIKQKWPESYARFSEQPIKDFFIDYENTPMIAYLNQERINEAIFALKETLEKDQIESCAMPRIAFVNFLSQVRFIVYE